MFHVGLSKEFPKVPFIRDNNNNEHPVIYQKEFTGRDCNKFMKHVGLENIVSDVSNTNIDFNIVIQSLINKNEINLCFHTWALRKLSKGIYIIPNDESVNIKSNFKYTICSLVPTFNSPENSVFVEGNIKVCRKNENVGFYPLNSCKFILNNGDHQFYVLVSILKDGTGEIIDISNNTSLLKEFSKIAITLHILIDPKFGEIKMELIVEYIKNIFKLDIS